jgi:hypothetical protein
MAPERKPRARSKARTTRSSGARKTSGAKRSSASRKPTKSGAGAKKTAATKKRPARPARPRKAAAPPVAEREVKTATRAKAESPGPSLRPGRNRDGMIRGIAVGALLLVVAVAVFLIATSGGDDEGDAVTSAETTIETTTPTETAPEPTTEAVPAAPAAPAPAPEQARQVENCQPILGNGAPFPVTSSASGGTEPASCTEARSVLLTALNQQATTVEDWRCVIDLTAQTVGVCKSGGRTIQAAGL